MTLAKPIGGYFGLELQQYNKFPYDDSILLNTARNCFEYILKANDIQRVYMPSYTCNVMFEPLEKLQIPYELYSVDDRLEICNFPNIGTGELILYTNYFGLKDKYCDELAKEYGPSLIIDCAQGFFYRPKDNCHVIYSPRKFVGVPDGGCLLTDSELGSYDDFPLDHSTDRMGHLLARIDKQPEEGYADFVKNDAALEGQPIRRMSKLTREILRSVDFEKIVAKRRKNFAYLNKEVDCLLDDWSNNACPLIFPYMAKTDGVKQSLIKKRIYVATYWPDILHQESLSISEQSFLQRLIALPIDQRYDEKDMKLIVEAIHECDD